MAISSRSNAFIADLCRLKQKKHRDETGLFYFEGTKLLEEALNSKYREKIRYIVAKEDIAGHMADMAGFEVTSVTREVYEKITDEKGFQGVMCVMEKQKQAELSYEKPVVILCSVRDPGNVGTVIRTADALCDADIILSGDCADIYSNKTQRAAMGAVFRQNIKISENIGEDIAKLKKNGYNVFAAHLDKDSRHIGEIEFGAKTAVAFGNEGKGLDMRTTEICGKKMTIPIRGKSDSLNVSIAAAIVLWEMGKANKYKKRAN
ncbi:MAG: RNA methyltransferase [Oscillospiraceae bacterium]|nr:RNA methyltransferase [Oscillospiraceae bacterium]